MKLIKLAVYLMALYAATVVEAKPGGNTVLEDKVTVKEEEAAPVDWGWGPRAPTSLPSKRNPLAAIQATKEGFREFDAAALSVASNAHVYGQFGTPFSTPVVLIHMALLPDGRVHFWGSDTQGGYGATDFHGVWDPQAGTGPAAFELLANTPHTNIFCAGMALLPDSGKLMIAGGATTINGDRNWSISDITVFDPQNDSLVPAQPMFYKRWYATIVALANGEMLVLGGREEKSPALYASTPEVYTPGTGEWRTLTGATNEDAYGGKGGAWYYPRAFPALNGKVFVVTNNGKMFYLTPTGTGSIVQATSIKAPTSKASFPTLYVGPGKLFSVRQLNNRVILVNLNGVSPTYTDTAPISGPRHWAAAVVLADGKVVVSGGSRIIENVASATRFVEIWDPATGAWTSGESVSTATAEKVRLYHSGALLLPDGSVLTAGGGKPGPVVNLNGEIYFPPYLFKTDGSGQWADRPSIASAPSTVSLGGTFNVTVANGDSIDRVTFVRIGTSTHTSNSNTRFMELLPFNQNGTTLTITAPANANVATPGYWMLFVLQGGVPSVAKILHLT